MLTVWRAALVTCAAAVLSVAAGRRSGADGGDAEVVGERGVGRGAGGGARRAPVAVGGDASRIGIALDVDVGRGARAACRCRYRGRVCDTGRTLRSKNGCIEVCYYI